MKRAALTIGLFVGVCWALQAYAGGLIKEGMTEWSFSVGYGRTFHFKGQLSNIDEDIKFVPFLVSWNKVFKELTSGASMEYAVEGVVSYIRQESEDAYLAGVTPLFIYNFKNYEKLIPYVIAGVGIVATNLSAEGFGGDWGFTPQVGIGFRYAINDDQFIRFSYRYHHISNAGLKSPNKSLDSNYFFIGYSFVR
jgi:lipid A 3-O-deacylase